MKRRKEKRIEQPVEPAGNQIRMLARFKDLQPGEICTIGNDDLVEWLISRQYAVRAD